MTGHKTIVFLTFLYVYFHRLSLFNQCSSDSILQMRYYWNGRARFFFGRNNRTQEKKKKMFKKKPHRMPPSESESEMHLFSYRGSGINVDGDLMVLTELGFERRFAFAQCRGFNLYPVCKNNDWKLDRWIYWRDECYLINIWMLHREKLWITAKLTEIGLGILLWKSYDCRSK